MVGRKHSSAQRWLGGAVGLVLLLGWSCDLDGAPRPAPAAPDEGVGALVDDVFVWMDGAGLHGVTDS